MNTQHTTTENTTIFVNLFAAIQADYQNRLTDFINGLNEFTEVKELLNKWQYTDLLTPTTKKKVWVLSDLKDYLIARKTKEVNKRITHELNKLQTVESAGELNSINISIEWVKSRMWGNNPKATANINYTRYESGSIGGCGYDKESTAFANAINQSNELLKALYLVKENNPTTPNRELFGYGSGYGILPYFEGGVGVSCYPQIFEKIGFKMNKTASGKTFDAWSITKAI